MLHLEYHVWLFGVVLNLLSSIQLSPSSMPCQPVVAANPDRWSTWLLMKYHYISLVFSCIIALYVYILFCRLCFSALLMIFKSYIEFEQNDPNTETYNHCSENQIGPISSSGPTKTDLVIGWNTSRYQHIS